MRPGAPTGPWSVLFMSASRATLDGRADVAELVDAHGSGPCGGNPVEVQVLSSALARLAGEKGRREAPSLSACRLEAYSRAISTSRCVAAMSSGSSLARHTLDHSHEARHLRRRQRR